MPNLPSPTPAVRARRQLPEHEQQHGGFERGDAVQPAGLQQPGCGQRQHAHCPADIQVAGEFSALLRVRSTVAARSRWMARHMSVSWNWTNRWSTRAMRSCGMAKPHLGEGGSFTNQLGGTVELQQAFTVIGTGSFTNDGTLLVDNAIVSADENPTLSVFLNNQGLVHVETGELELSGRADSTGNFLATPAPSCPWGVILPWNPSAMLSASATFAAGQDIVGWQLHGYQCNQCQQCPTYLYQYQQRGARRQLSQPEQQHGGF